MTNSGSSPDRSKKVHFVFSTILRKLGSNLAGMTRNRITFMYPPWPGTLDFTGFSEGSKAKNHICSPHQFSPKSEVFFGGQMLR